MWAHRDTRPGTLVELPVCETGVGGDQREPVGHRVDDDLEQVGEVELHGAETRRP